jgi:hypothetical protein
LIVLGSDLAFESIISGGGVTLQIGYVTPVLIVRPLLPLWSYSMSTILVVFDLDLSVILVSNAYPTLGPHPWSQNPPSATALRPRSLGIPDQHHQRVLVDDRHHHVPVPVVHTGQHRLD